MDRSENHLVKVRKSKIYEVPKIDDKLEKAFKKQIKKRNNFNPLIKQNKNIPYLIDQHLLEKENV